MYIHLKAWLREEEGEEETRKKREREKSIEASNSGMKRFLTEERSCIRDERRSRLIYQCIYFSRDLMLVPSSILLIRRWGDILYRATDLQPSLSRSLEHIYNTTRHTREKRRERRQRRSSKPREGKTSLSIALSLCLSRCRSLLLFFEELLLTSEETREEE